jgi:hypothetical protein
MSFIEQLAIEFMLALLAAVIKNPEKAAQLQTQLLGIAGDIAGLYGYTLTPPATPAATQQAKPVTTKK